jgi:hypothetical protein
LSGRKIKLGVAAGVAGLSLLTGGLLFGSTLVSAQEPTPQATQEPAPQTTPQTPQDRAPDGDHDKGDCPNMQNGQQGDQSGAQGDSSSTRFRGMHRTFAQ